MASIEATYLELEREREGRIPSFEETLEAVPEPPKKVAMKANGSKAPGMSLLPPSFVVAVAAVRDHGAQKYEDWDWINGGRNITDYLDAIERHFLDLVASKDLDAESGIHNAAHIACCCMFLIEHFYSGNNLLIDNRNVHDVRMMTVDEAHKAISATRIPYKKPEEA